MRWLRRLLADLQQSHVSRPQLGVEGLESRDVPSATAFTPVYSVTFGDAVTGDNAFTGADGNRYWTIDSGADRYQEEVYERPTAQTYEVVNAADSSQQFAAKEYYQNLDLVQARAGFDDKYLYVSLDLAGVNKSTSDGKDTAEGLIYQYGFRLAKEPDGGRGFLLVVDSPALKGQPTNFTGGKSFGYRDVNGDVGGAGLTVTKEDSQAEVNGNGYEKAVIADGKLASGAKVMWTRVDPNDASIVEFVVDYKALGFTKAELKQLGYLDFEANKGTKDPGNYLWNDEYTKSEAGSPYRATQGDTSKSEFGTQGLGNIYELDTVRGGAIRQGGSLSGFVYLDADDDGIKDADEDGIAEVLITLIGFDADGNPFTRTTMTDVNGAYRFDDLTPGTYRLVEEQPAQFVDGEDTAGSLGGEAGDDVIDFIQLAEGDEGIDYNFGERSIEE